MSKNNNTIITTVRVERGLHEQMAAIQGTWPIEHDGERISMNDFILGAIVEKINEIRSNPVAAEAYDQIIQAQATLTNLRETR